LQVEAVRCELSVGLQFRTEIPDKTPPPVAIRAEKTGLYTAIFTERITVWRTRQAVDGDESPALGCQMQ